MNKFIILTNQRSGSSLVDSTLNNHPEILCLGETFLYRFQKKTKFPHSYYQYQQKSIKRKLLHYIYRKSSVFGYLDELFSLSDYKAIGFKLMYGQIKRFRAVEKYIRTHPNVQIILNLRQNHLKRFVSLISAQQRQQWHIKEEISVKKIKLPTETLIRDLKKIEGDNSKLKQLVSNLPNPVHENIYENFINDKKMGTSEMLKFLNIGYQDLTSELKKINPDNINEILDNYDDVLNKLKGTKFEWYLD